MKLSTLVSPDLFHLLRPLIILEKYSGFLPVAYEQKGAKYSLRESLNAKIYSLVLASILLVFSMLGLADDFPTDRSVRMRNPTMRYIILVDLGEIALTVFVGIMTTPLKLSYFWRILEGFGKIERVQKMCYVKERNRSMMAMGVSLGIALGVLLFDMILWGMNSEDMGIFVKRFGVFYVVYFLTFLQEIPFCFFARVVRVYVEGLNGVLRQGLNKGANEQWVSLARVSRQEIVKNKGLTHERLNDFMKLVEDVDDVIDAINDFCGIHTLLILLSCLLHLVVTPYFLLVELCNEGYPPFIFLQVAWILTHVARLMIIVETCQRCINEYKNTVNLVLKLLTSELLPNIKEQVEILTVQISNKKVKFSSFGMVKISRSILTAFGGSVTTFLVILFQYGGAGGKVYIQK